MRDVLISNHLAHRPAFLLPAPEVLAEHTSVRMEAKGRRKSSQMGRSGRVKGGQIWVPQISAGKTRKAQPEGYSGWPP